MRLLRSMIVLGLLVGGIWVSTSVEIDGKTPFGHGRTWWKKSDPLAELLDWVAPDEPRPAPKQRAPKPKRREAMETPPPKVVEKEATKKRVAMLEKAAAELEKGQHIPVGEKPSASQKKALDELVSSRLPRR